MPRIFPMLLLNFQGEGMVWPALHAVHQSICVSRYNIHCVLSAYAVFCEIEKKLASKLNRSE